ncbi:Fe-S cluster assembly protein SufD [Pedobacter hiemivivus]|uniref:Fe-S cluster assembly protein SufD n=1 Tax=Pedobacter hiemivivus TaxID=2530454 RepID=A0A4U1GMQ6_9SPHI|nr:Fe-S cluster assembly protein SufD [Pedobacter hiemivivus]TKC65588.1 Fe-S cluster assembly protein SufD [Pedobacter hiemivivus]
MIDLTYLNDRFEHLQQVSADDGIAGVRKNSFDSFSKTGLPTYRTEDWKYTSIGNLFDQSFEQAGHTVSLADLEALRMPGHHKANELVFVNGRFDAALSNFLSTDDELIVLSLKDAAKGEYKDLVARYLNKSSEYMKDGVHALNGAFIEEGVFVYVHKGKTPQHPLYIYHILDGRAHPVMAQPRGLIYIDKNSRLQLTETYVTLGVSDSFCNGVLEVVVDQNAYVEYYKIQNDASNASQVSTTHITQIGRSYVHTVTVTLNGGVVRNNMNLVLDADGNETHLYGLYLLKGKTHADNHTMIDNRQPNCFSNQLYKGIADDFSTAVFNGKIMVQPNAQKTNSFQSNKNILLSDNATINTKPQLEIFADDVKCSHGCTVGQLDEEALFYLRARGIPKEKAEVLLLQAYAADVLTHIKPMAIRAYVEKLIYEHLSIV